MKSLCVQTAHPSNELQWHEVTIGHQDISTSNDCLGDMPFCQAWDLSNQIKIEHKVGC